jgi:hypothetical protein
MERKPIVSFGIAAGLLLAVMAKMALWMVIETRNEPFTLAKTQFLNYFPSEFQNGMLITFFSVAFLGVAAMLFLNVIKSREKQLKPIAIPLTTLSMLLLFWNIVSLL